MATIGFHAGHEQHPPSRLLYYVRRAEQAGFAAAMCSDHFHPWSERQGQSGFTWSWLGAALQATSLSFGTVCSPAPRYHPAIIAQAAATLCEMYPGRFWLAVGSGEALNESITGQLWPDKPQRNARLREAVEVMRALWRGETVTHQGLVTVHQARLYTRPMRPPLLLGAAITGDTAAWMAPWVDGLITVASPPEEFRTFIRRFHDAGGAGKPLFVQVALSFAASQEEALAAAHDQWRHAALDMQKVAQLPTPWAFDAATADAPADALLNKLRIAADPQQHIEWLAGDLELGATALYLNPVGGNVERFIDLFGEQVLPLLASVQSFESGDAP